ncbi:MAG TPA: TolC family protein [Chitinophagaceae bacterium]|nr:TolC family protein [Chitinophagaceae bacterium]HPG10495.1 TolC family protein [Chitinophagaceae bacterium]
MKYTFLSLLIFMTGFCSYCQTDSTTISGRTGAFDPRSDSVVERLVGMALNNPRIGTLENVAIQYEYEYKRGKTAWLNNLQVAGNLNELSLKQGSSSNPLQQSTQFPRYNIGVIVPMGLFINNGKQNKANYYRYQSLLESLEVEKQKIRREVILKYEDYNLQKQLLALQQVAIQDAKILLKKHEEDFENGKITLEQYTTTGRTYNTEQVKEVNILSDIRVIEAELEELIGMKITVALDVIKAQLGYSN